MLRKVFAMSVAACLIAGTAEANTINPKFDLTGLWAGDSSGTARYYQEGAEVNYLFVGDAHVSSFVGRYVSPTRIEGVEHRVDTADGCKTELLSSITAKSTDTVSYSKRALDSNCDLVRDQLFVGRATRAMDAPPAAPPTCSRFTPSVGIRGTVVTITGQNFISVRSVVFRDTSTYSYSVISPTTIKVPVPEDAEAGGNLISVNTQGGQVQCPGSFNVHMGK